jgi:outer membrane protein OmpA-like peptidoglycan-associated protein
MRFFPAAIAGVTILSLSACDPAQLQTAPGEPSNTQKGAIIGGLLGGVIGGTRKGDKQGLKAVVGAGIGAAIGGAIGQQLDIQAAELRQEMGDDRISIVNTSAELVVTMPQDILFDVDSTYVRPGLRDDLFALASNLQRYPGSTIIITGHTDNTGTASYNQDLSARRAVAVQDVLITAGVTPSRLRAIGRGEDRPIASNLTPEGRAQNRRVEIVIRPNA